MFAYLLIVFLPEHFSAHRCVVPSFAIESDSDLYYIPLWRSQNLPDNISFPD